MQSRPIPSWVKNTCGSRHAASLDQYAILRASCDRETLFDAIYLCLSSITAEPYTAEDLQHCVANAVLQDNDATTNAMIETWRSIVSHAHREKDTALMEEYAWAAPLLYDTNDARQQLYQNMLDRNLYQGDDHAIAVLERTLNVRILLLEKVPTGGGYFGSTLRKMMEQSEDFQPNWYFVLCHSLDPHPYYQPIALKLSKQQQKKAGEIVYRHIDFIAAFQREELPHFLESLHE